MPLLNFYFIYPNKYKSLSFHGNFVRFYFTVFPIYRKITQRRLLYRFTSVFWKEWCWSWNSSTLAISCEELTHWKRFWSWEGLGAGGKGDNRGWDGWMASLTRWTWVWVNSGSWWWTGRPGVLQFMGSQRVGHDWATELNWTEPIIYIYTPLKFFYWVIVDVKYHMFQV